jgi:alpha/beta superfamily hydrolase
MPDVIINGAEGRLEGRYTPAKTDRAPVAVLLHPHPQYGGTMHNKVVYTLNQCFLQAGFATLRFNFRGVGRSQGSFARGEGELTDAASALDWIQAYNANASACWIYDFGFLAPCPSSGLIIQGDKDEIVSEESVQKLTEKLGRQKDIVIDYRVIKGANHFFMDRLDKLAGAASEYISDAIKPGAVTRLPSARAKR